MSTPKPVDICHTDDDLDNVTASPDDVAYESGWHDGVDYGYRLARRELGVDDAE